VGKSFVAGVLAGLGCHVLDADDAARSVVEPRTRGLAAVVEAFGAEVLRADGTLDRVRLGALVFGDVRKRKLLNSILHPLIIAAQMPQDEKLRYADFRIDSSGSFEETRRQTEKVFESLSRLAGEAAAKT